MIFKATVGHPLSSAPMNARIGVIHIVKLFRSALNSIVKKSRELAIRHRHPIDGKRRQIETVLRSFVLRPVGATHHKRAGWNTHHLT
jgi:hypothetical protein